MESNLAFIGLGAMGSPIARNLLAAGYRLHVYNRSAGKAAPFSALGATVAANPVDAVSTGGVLATMLADDRALLEVVTANDAALAMKLGANGVHVSMSTIAPATARRLAQLHASYGSAFVAAPVFGRPDAAAARKLFVAVAGPETARQRVLPLLQNISQRVFDFGEQPEAANVVKLAGNFLLASAIEAIAEALTMAERNGVSRTSLMNMLTQTLFACAAYENYGKNITQREFVAGFRLLLGLKDVDLVSATATESRSPMPLASLLHDRFLASVAKGRGDLDWSAIALDVLEQAGENSPKR